MVVTGGPITHGFVEAQAMLDWLINHGVSEERILVEVQAQSVVDNARFTRTLLRHTESVTVVTSANHICQATVVCTLACGSHATGISAVSDLRTAMPNLLWTYRDAVTWFLE